MGLSWNCRSPSWNNSNLDLIFCLFVQMHCYVVDALGHLGVRQDIVVTREGNIQDALYSSLFTIHFKTSWH